MATVDRHGWFAKVHVYPVNDLRSHTMEDCWCNPTHDEEDEIIIHNSADEREKFETQERKPS
jgi:hypothetical protein